jgi:hypothetical protein
LAEVDQGFFSAYLRVFSISAAARGAAGQVVWIDTRYGRSDLWMGLLLHPNSWANSDVFALPLAQVVQRGPAAARMRPVRLTKDLSNATMVRAHAGEKRLYVVWAGRSKVGREVTSAGKPPEIFYTTLPLQ